MRIGLGDGECCGVAGPIGGEGRNKRTELALLQGFRCRITPNLRFFLAVSAPGQRTGILYPGAIRHDAGKKTGGRAQAAG